MPSGDVPEESLSIVTQGCCSASATSGSDMPNTATSVTALSSMRKSKMVSIGSLFQSLGDIREASCPEAFQFGILDDADQDILRTGDLVPLVVPAFAGRLHIFANAGANCGVFEPLNEFGVAAVVRPWRNERREAVEPSGIGVGVGADVDASAARPVDLRDDLRHAPPIGLPADFEMPDLDWHVRFAADADGFVNGGENVSPSLRMCVA